MPEDELDSLDRDVTRAHGPESGSSASDSLDRGQTAGESGGSSSSDISQFDEGWEQAESSTGFGKRYEVQSAIGHGGMGQVFRATDNRLKRPVAIKRLKEDLSRNRRAVERFSTEAEAVARLNHYNIVQIYDVGQDRDGRYIVMELVEGKSLAQRLKEDGPFGLSMAIDLTSQLCDALHYAHQQGIVHRDIKPANILLTESGTPKLTDFGLARLESDHQGQTQAGAVLGTIDFMPPEQHLDASRADARSDQWALAATFYQMMTGESPRVIRSERVDESVRAIVLRALEEDPSRRFADCREFRDALQQTQSSPVDSARKLTAGECSSCGHVNESTKAFCEACGTSLRVPCPTCQQQVGVWATFCGECGTDIASDLESKRIELLQQQKELDSMRRSYRHAEAISLLEATSRLSHPAFADQKAWAEEKLKEYRAELSQLEGQRDEILVAASQRMNSHDVEGTLQLLERVPEPLSNPRMDALRKQATSRAEEIRKLGAEIRAAVEARELDGLLVKVEQFLELRPHDEKALKLRGQLQRREHKRAESAAENADATAQADPEPASPASQPDLAYELPPAPVITTVPSKSRRKFDRRIVHASLALLLLALAVPITLLVRSRLRDPVVSELGNVAIAPSETGSTDEATDASVPPVPSSDSLESMGPSSTGEGFVSLRVLVDPRAQDNFNWIVTETELRELQNRFAGSGSSIRAGEQVGYASAESAPGLSPLYRYRTKSKRRYLFSTERRNEPSLEAEKLLGWVSLETRDDTTPLYRLWDRASGRRRLTIDPKLRAERVAAGDDESPILAHVFRDPSLNTARSEPPDRPPSHPSNVVEDAEWTSLFNGRDLSGWRGGTSSIVGRRDSTSAEDPNSLLAQLNIKPDSQNWIVENGILRSAGRGSNVNLYTVKHYADFELSLEWKIAAGGDSGVLLRGYPQVQIWDPGSGKTDAKKGSGGLYNNKTHASTPSLKADLPVGQWNHFLIRMVGQRVTVDLNGERVVDRVVMENFYKPKLPLDPGGPIGLQEHTGSVSFRNIRLREIKKATQPTPSQNTAPQTTENQVTGRPRIVAVDELNGGVIDTSPWVTPDGLTVYWLREGMGSAGIPGKIWTASRNSRLEKFSTGKPVMEGRLHSLTADELMIIYLSSGEDAALCRAKRSRRDDPFAQWEKIDELASLERPKSPWISADGLTLLVNSYLPNAGVVVQESTRRSRASRWSPPRRLPLNASVTVPTWPSLTDDGLTMFIADGGGKQSAIMVGHRDNQDAGFTSAFSSVTVDNRIVYGRAPRYVAATKELWYAACPDVTKNAWELRVVQNYVPPTH